MCQLAALLFVVSCGSETSAGGEQTNDPTANSAQNITTEQDATQTGSPPPDVQQELPASCSILDKESVRRIFSLDEEQALIPVHGQLIGSCYYRFATEKWSADLVLETINTNQENIFQTQFDEATERIQFKGHDARWANGGRILLVNAEEPYIVKLSMLPRGQYGKAPNEAERRALIEEVAELVNEKN